MTIISTPNYTRGYGSNVICMYSGVVTKAGREGGYGHRIHIKLDKKIEWQGKEYTCYQAYAHCLKLLKNVGQKVNQGDTIAIEAGHGSRGPRDYGSHVDQQTYFFLNGEKITVNFEYLAKGATPGSFTNFVQEIPLLKKGMEHPLVRLVQEKLKLTVDGKFGPATEAGVKAFQEEMNLTTDGIVGEETGKDLGLFEYQIYIDQDTVIKKTAVQSSLITNSNHKFALSTGSWLQVNWVEEQEGKEGHWYCELDKPQNGFWNWFIFKDHVQVFKCYEQPIQGDADDAGETSEKGGEIKEKDTTPALERWTKALEKAKTKGCGQMMANAEGVRPGVAGSKQIAAKSMPHYTPERIAQLKRACDELDLPLALVMAIGSRESHAGAILGKWGNKPGWGDNNHGFGIMQVDKRFHNLKGTHDPFSYEHIKQATGILKSYISQIGVKHPDWDDSNVLKGGVTAYNAGVSSVRTISKMAIGTTGNDYPEDVIARAHYFTEQLNNG